MSPNDWTAIGLIVMLVVSWVGTLHRRVSGMNNLSERYVPRPQIDARFAAVEKRWERELQTMERHSEKQFEQVHTKLDRIIDRIEQKADK